MDEGKALIPDDPALRSLGRSPRKGARSDRCNRPVPGVPQPLPSCLLDSVRP